MEHKLRKAKRGKEEEVELTYQWVWV